MNLDDSQDGAVWYDGSEETEDAEDVTDNEVESESEGGDYQYTSTSITALFRVTKSIEVKNEHSLP